MKQKQQSSGGPVAAAPHLKQLTEVRAGVTSPRQTLPGGEHRGDTLTATPSAGVGGGASQTLTD